jgi:hypothetical protein
VPAGHADLLDGIYGHWGEGLRSLEIVSLGKNPERLDSGFIEQIVRERAETTEVGAVELSGPRDKSTVGDRTPALLTSSS